MIGAWARKLYGSGIIAASLVGQRRRPYLPRHRLEDIRDRRVRGMVRYAARRVPYYREWFRRSGVDPREIRGAADLRHLPILDREQVRSQPGRFLAEGPAARGALSFRTSGTTGTPIEIHHDRRSLLANVGYGERERAPQIAICGSFRPSELYVGYETSTFKKVTAFYEHAARFPVRPRRRFVSLLTPVDEVVSLLEVRRPEILVGYGGWIGLFFRAVEARGLEVHRPKMVMYMGESLPPGTRELIEDTLGIPVLSRYNAVEAFKIGFYCQDRMGFHLHEDLCHVRILDDEGLDAPAGAQGEVMISNLVNRATVLLNYPMGDMASFTEAACSCGRTFRLLSELEGRKEDILVLADGRTVHPRAIWPILKEESAVLQYQIVQRTPRSYGVRLVISPDAPFPPVRERIVRKLGLLLGEAVIDVERCDSIRPGPGRKLRAVVGARAASESEDA